MATKITKTTFKTFIRKNSGNLFIKVRSSFDGMVDGCVWDRSAGFTPAAETTEHVSHTFGIRGAWLVGGGRDYFNEFNKDGFRGIKVYNSCGTFVVAAPEQNQ